MMFLFLVLVCLVGCADEYERVGGCPLVLRALSYSGLALLKISLFNELSESLLLMELGICLVTVWNPMFLKVATTSFCSLSARFQFEFRSRIRPSSRYRPQPFCLQLLTVQKGYGFQQARRFLHHGSCPSLHQSFLQ